MDNNLHASFNKSIDENWYFHLPWCSDARDHHMHNYYYDFNKQIKVWQLARNPVPQQIQKTKFNTTSKSLDCAMSCGLLKKLRRWEDNMMHTTNMEQRTCSCRYRQLFGLLCCDAISALYKPEKILDYFLAKTSWMWREVANRLYLRLAPPGYLKVPRKLRKRERREAGEASKGQQICGNWMQGYMRSLQK